MSPRRRSGTSTAPWRDGACVCMVARWRAIRRRQVEAERHGAAAIVPRLCGVLTGATTMAAAATMAASKATRSIFEAFFARSEAPKMERCLVEKSKRGTPLFYSAAELFELCRCQKHIRNVMEFVVLYFGGPKRLPTQPPHDKTNGFSVAATAAKSKFRRGFR